MANRNRDDFTQATVQRIAKRAGWLCSFPTCRKFTVGATSDDDKNFINIGTAAHICAAAPGGPRYDETMSPEERSSAANGIWMCRDHGKAIDSTDSEFTVEKLRLWKIQAEAESRRRVLQLGPDEHGPDCKMSDLAERFTASAHADLEVFRRTSKWPSTSIALTLKVEGFDEPVTTTGLANAVTSLDDLILVAPPGMGKTSTLFQVAESMLADTQGTPIFVPLGDWATENSTFLESILKRPAFRGISEEDFRQVASHPGVALLLDGWNELDPTARNRVRVQLTTLKAELPELGFIISTRKQTLDVPFAGLVVGLLPLNEEQQMDIGTAVKGEEGERIVDRAWRTPGVRELITTPLYLTTLLSLPEGADLPTTKEEILRCFVATHEGNHANAEVLNAATQGFQQQYLEGLAVLASRNASTAIADESARRSISETSNYLAGDGQIATKPQPRDLLDVLVSHHVLMRPGETPGYSFQHQQFQEWYASHYVEHLIIDAAKNLAARESLRAKILDAPAWEESIFFAVERLARGDKEEQKACGEAILAAFEVDPLLAAEMIFRVKDEVWAQVGTAIQDFISRWHTLGRVDRAVRFMLTSGRPEFFDAVWPLISNEDDQISLNALRNCRRFHTSILGGDAEAKIRALSKHSRSTLLSEIAMHGGIDGMDLVAAIAKNDPDPEVQASVAQALAFRRADRHVAEVLANASDAVFDLVAEKDIADDIADANVKCRIEEALKRRAAKGKPNAERLRSILSRKDNEDRSGDVANVVEAIEMGQQRDAEERLIYEAHIRYPEAVAQGILARIRSGKPLFYETSELLDTEKFVLEDDELVQLAISDVADQDRAEAAASVVGPIAVGRILDAYLEAWAKLFPRERADEDARERSAKLRRRLQRAPMNSLIEAMSARSAQATNEQMSQFADLLSERTQDMAEAASVLDAAALKTIQDFVIDWGARMLVSGAKRAQTANIAILASRAPSVGLLPTLKQLLDDNLQRYRAFRAEAEANGWRQGNALDESRQPMTSEYQWAFTAIKAPETVALMQEYLRDEGFAETAARVLALHWRAANEPEVAGRLRFRPDLSTVKEKRKARAAAPDTTSAEAEAIFAAIEPLIADGATEKQKNLAVALGIIACGLPHGQRDDTIHKLIAAASRRSRSALLLNLTLSGQEIDIKLIIEGIGETLEAAKADEWILSQSDGYELRDWLLLVPFGSQPMEAIDIIRSMPAAQREPRFLEEMVSLLADSPSPEAEDMLFKLAEDDPRFYANASWQRTALQFGTPSSARRFLELVAAGALNGRWMSEWQMGREFGSLLRRQPELRAYVYQLLQAEPNTPGHGLLVRAVAEAPDEEGLLLLLRLEEQGAANAVTWQTIERLVTEQVPSATWKGAFDVVPVPAISVRKSLLALTEDGGPTDYAARWLRQIDSLRDEHGFPEAEPRHPDLASGKPWPVLRPDPDA